MKVMQKEIKLRNIICKKTVRFTKNLLTLNIELMSNTTDIKKIKLSDKAKDVIVKMREGWQCASSIYLTGNGSWFWLQKGGIGYGGESLQINGNTFNSLTSKKLIYFSGRRFPNSYYSLTELGKTIQL
jgi:hypothetical protein